jgi:hypothetical protein
MKIIYLESVHNADTLRTDYLENRIFAAFRRENAKSVRNVPSSAKLTRFADGHSLFNFMAVIALFTRHMVSCGRKQKPEGVESPVLARIVPAMVKERTVALGNLPGDEREIVPGLLSGEAAVLNPAFKEAVHVSSAE